VSGTLVSAFADVTSQKAKKTRLRDSGKI